VTAPVGGGSILPIAFGPAGSLPAGYARVPTGTVLLRGHDPAWPPDFFGPPPGARGTQRFDVPRQPPTGGLGTCYLAFTLEGVLLERVVRDFPRPTYSAAALARRHALASAALTRDVVLLDLVVALAAHGLQAAQIVTPPLLPPTDPPPSDFLPYPTTQSLATTWQTAPHPVPVDGILYGSRFGGAHLCVALWEAARLAVAWRGSGPLGADLDAVATALRMLGMGLEP
jgi:hypothetical protein